MKVDQLHDVLNEQNSVTCKSERTIRWVL